MSLATLKMIDDLISTCFDEAYMENSEPRVCVIPLDGLVNRLQEIHSHLEESLKRDGQSFVEDVEDKS